MTAAEPPVAVLFDFYGTLATGQPKRLYEEVLAPLPSAMAAAVLDDIENVVEFPLGLALPEPFGSAAAYEGWLWRQAVERLSRYHLAGAPAVEVEELAGALLDCNQVVGLTVLPGIPKLLAGLTEAGVRLGVCSNWTWDLPEVLARLGLAPYLETVVCSARVAVSKPHEAIYRHALVGLGHRPEEVLFVGDTPDTDVLGPRRLGMDAVLVPSDGSGLPWLTRRLLGSEPVGAS